MFAFKHVTFSLIPIMNSSSLLTVLVYAIRYEAQGIVSVELRALDGSQLPAFEAGSHIDLHLDNGLVRSYSLSNSPDEQHRYVVGVLNDKNSRGGSRFVHEKLRVGQTLKISAPRNNFELDETAKQTVLVAGGIGITPIFCMFNRMRSLGKPVKLIYCARSAQEAAFLGTLKEAEAGSLLTHFDSEKGGPPDLKALLAEYGADTHYYCCGPTPMLDAFERVLGELSYPNVHIERFSAAGDVTASQESGYTVECRKSNKVLTVPAGMALLDALLDAGLPADYSCREGVCGACELSVLEGEPDHRDSVLSNSERAANKTMMVCVSGCKGNRLVLDI